MEQPIENHRFKRQILAFGDEGQRNLVSTRVGIVGLGGLGSHISQALAYLGVRSFVLVDDDVVEVTNLNRLIGAAQGDLGMPKVSIASRTILTIAPDASVQILQRSLRSPEAFAALCECNVIFGCLDNDGARLILTEMAAAYSIPLIDSASEIGLGENGKPDFWGGRVLFALAGLHCAVCAGQVDLEVARQELETGPEKQFRQNHGYGLGEHVPAPAVVSLNGVIANLAVTEFLVFVTGLREPAYLLTYKAERGVVTLNTDPPSENCYVCNSVAGKGSLANVERYLSTELPKDIPV